MKEKFEYKYIGKINNYLKFKLLKTIAIAGFWVFLIASFNGKLVATSIMIIILSSIIYVLLKFNDEDNLILFTNEKLIYLNKKTITEFNYEELIKIEFINLENNNYVKLNSKLKKFKFDIDTKNELDVNLIDFITFLFSKNSKLIVNQKISIFRSYTTYEYIQRNNQIERIEID